MSIKDLIRKGSVTVQRNILCYINKLSMTMRSSRSDLYTLLEKSCDTTRLARLLTPYLREIKTSLGKHQQGLGIWLKFYQLDIHKKLSTPSG